MKKIPKRVSWHLQQRMIERDRLIRSGFAAATQSRLTADWILSPIALNEALKTDLRLMRQRARELERNSILAKRWLSLFGQNVVGKSGFVLQAKTTLDDEKTPDEETNDILEKEFKRWSGRQFAFASEDTSFHEGCLIGSRTWARDGELILRCLEGYPNEYGFALEAMDSEALDEKLNQNLRNGNRIRLGVEYDSFGRRVAYYFKVENATTEDYPENYGYPKHRRIPAEEIIHLFVRYHFKQRRGVPMLHASMMQINMLEAYQEAHIVAARIGASQAAWFQQGEGATPTPGLAEDEEAEKPTMPMAPGSMGILPQGWDIKDWKPEFPQDVYPHFTKQAIRDIASGVDTSYNSLGNNLEDVNFSSIRAGLLDERDGWKILQELFKIGVMMPVYTKWLRNALLTRLKKKLSFADFEKYLMVEFFGRRWPWVDPYKDVLAAREEIALGLRSRQEILNEQGRQFEDVVNQLAEEDRILKEKGVVLASQSTAPKDALDKEVEVEEDPGKKPEKGDKDGGKKKPEEPEEETK